MKLQWLARAPAMVLMLLLVVASPGRASAAGSDGWHALGNAGTAGSHSLNGAVHALDAQPTGQLLVGGNFTAAGGVTGADRIARWDWIGGSWSALSSPTSAIGNGGVFAIADDPATGYVYAGGTFQNAGGDANADFLARWDGTSWGAFCNAAGPAFGGNVDALQIVGDTLYVGGEFQNGGGIATADYLLACDLTTGASAATTVDPNHFFSGPVYALAADSNGSLYAGGRFLDLENIPAADNVAYLDTLGAWHAMGTGGGACSCAIDGFVRALATNGTDVYVGTDVKDVAGIAQADNVVKWNGSAWSALGANTAGTGGWFPASTYIYGMATRDGSGAAAPTVFATGSFQDADGNPLADNIAVFDGSAWHPVGSNGAGNGPWVGNGLALAVPPQAGPDGSLPLFAGGNFTSAGGDTTAWSAASLSLNPKLTVSLQGGGVGTVQGSGIHCPGTCTVRLPFGSTFGLSVSVEPGSDFMGFAGCLGLQPCTGTLNADTTVNAFMYRRPVCTDLAVTTVAGSAATFQLPCSDSAGRGLYFGEWSGGGPFHGTLSPLDANGQIPSSGLVTYTPAAGYSGPDSFFFGVEALEGPTPLNVAAFSNQATVSITVTAPPPVTEPVPAAAGFGVAGPNVTISLGKLRPAANGDLSVGAHNSNTFPVDAVSWTMTSSGPIAASARATRRRVVTFFKSSKVVAVAPGKTVPLKGRLSATGRAVLKKRRSVAVTIRIVLRAPNGTKKTLTRQGKLLAPARARRH